MNYLFYECSSLVKLPDISKWNTSNVQNMSYLFYECSKLRTLPDISKWDTSNVQNMSHLFCYCSSLINLPDISKWNITNVSDISYIFYSCSSLITLPNILKWNPNNLISINCIYDKCYSLIDFPDISKWNININEKNDIIPQNQFAQLSNIISLVSKKDSSFKSKELKSEDNDCSDKNTTINIYNDIQNEDIFNKNNENLDDDYYNNFYK